jgi:hypothetical protein
MPNYMILIYGDEKEWEGASEADIADIYQRHGEFAKQVPETGGKILAGDALEPTSTATSISEGVVTAGPFAETAEQLGGYYLVEARDLDHALEIGKMVPTGKGGGTIEVRPIVVFS